MSALQIIKIIAIVSAGATGIVTLIWFVIKAKFMDSYATKKYVRSFLDSKIEITKRDIQIEYLKSSAEREEKIIKKIEALGDKLHHYIDSKLEYVMNDLGRRLQLIKNRNDDDDG